LIASFSRGFVFIKGRKTAGTSIEIALSRFCSEGDVITPVSPFDETVRRREGGRAPQNYCDDRTAEERFRRAIEGGDLAEIRKAGRDARRHRTFRNHMPAGRVAARLPEGFWRAAFKFTVDRHPYEKAVSLAHFAYARAVRKHSSLTFDEHLDRIVQQGKYRNFDLYSEDGVPVVDAVLRYEDMPGCFLEVQARTGIAFAQGLPFTKHRFRTDRRPAVEVLSDRQKALVQKVCHEEFELSGYAR